MSIENLRRIKDEYREESYSFGRELGGIDINAGFIKYPDIQNIRRQEFVELHEVAKNRIRSARVEADYDSFFEGYIDVVVDIWDEVKESDL